jgi:hypothetical protein
MADEITWTCGLTLANGDLDGMTIPSRSMKITQATAVPSRVGGNQTIGFAAHEALVLTGLTTLGVAYFRNRAPANFVQIGVDVDGTFYPLVRLNAGEGWAFRLAQGITPYAKADTGAVVLQREILDA